MDAGAALPGRARASTSIVTSGGLGPTADDLTARGRGRLRGRGRWCSTTRWRSASPRSCVRCCRAGPTSIRRRSAPPTASRRWCPRARRSSSRSAPRPGSSCRVGRRADGRRAARARRASCTPMWPARAWPRRPSARRSPGAVELRQEMLRLFGIPESEIAETLRARRGRPRPGGRWRSRPACAAARSRSSRASSRGAQDVYDALRGDASASATPTRCSPTTGARSTQQVADLLRSQRAARSPRPSRAPAGCWPARLTELAGSSDYVLGRARRLLQRGQDRAGGRRSGRSSSASARCPPRSPRRWPTARGRALARTIGVGHHRGRRAGRRDARTSRSGLVCFSVTAADGARLTRRAEPARATAPTCATARPPSPCTCCAGCLLGARRRGRTGAMSARLFAALELPADVRAGAGGLRTRGRRTTIARCARRAADALHLTLAFLGHRALDEIDPACAVVRGIGRVAGAGADAGGGAVAGSAAPARPDGGSGGRRRRARRRSRPRSSRVWPMPCRGSRRRGPSARTSRSRGSGRDWRPRRGRPARRRRGRLHRRGGGLPLAPGGGGPRAEALERAALAAAEYAVSLLRTLVAPRGRQTTSLVGTAPASSETTAPALDATSEDAARARPGIVAVAQSTAAPRTFVTNARRAVTRTCVRSGSVRSGHDTALLTKHQPQRGPQPHAHRRGEGRQGPRRRPAGRAHADRAAVRQGHRHAHGRRGRAGERRRDPHRRAVARPRAGHRRRPARAHRRGLRPGVLGQDDADLPRPRRGPEARRRVRVHRRRARDGPAVRARDRRRHRRAARLPARLRRAGARDRRHARALGRGRRRRHRLGRRADAARRARGPDGRPDRRPAGADDVPGDAQARRQPQPHADAVPVHQPDPREGRA